MMKLVYPYPESRGIWEWEGCEEIWSYAEMIAPDIVVEEDYAREWAEWQMICLLPGIARRVSEIHRQGRFNSLDKLIIKEWEYALNLNIGT